MQLPEMLGAGRVNFETKSPNCSIGSIQHDDILIVYFCGRVGKLVMAGWILKLPLKNIATIRI